MSESRFNPISTSGAGFKLEHCVQATYVAALLLETPIPFQQGILPTSITFQGKLKARTDDVIIAFSDGQTHYVQSKKGFGISGTATFYEVIASMCHDVDQPTFKAAQDKVIVVTDVLTKADIDDGLTVLNWARTSSSAKEFAEKLQANKGKRIKYDLFAKAIKTYNASADDEQVWRYLKCLFIKEYDYLDAGSKDMQMLCWYIQPFLSDGHSPDMVVSHLLAYVIELNKDGATLTAANARHDIKKLFSPNKNPKIGNELRELLVKSRGSLTHTIHNKIGAFHLNRRQFIDQLHSLTRSHSFVAILGDGGVGKSALAKDFILTHYNDAIVIYVKADQLDRSSLAAALSEMGVSADFETLLAQGITSPSVLIYIDSFEKLYESDHKEAILELLGKVRGFNNVSILVTCRNYAFETLKSKLMLAKGPVGLLPLGPLTDQETQEVKSAVPTLGSLIDNPRLKNLINIPFYLDLAMSVAESLSATAVLDDTRFKNLLWEKVIEKRGETRPGISASRAKVFSKITLSRATSKKAFIQVEEGVDLSIVEALQNEVVLIKHPEVDAYAPAHDIFEDIVVARHLQNAFMQKENSISFLQGVDTNPVFRRGIRAWIQDLLQSHPEESKLFLKDVLDSSLSLPIIDELLIGILGSNHCYDLMKLYPDVFTGKKGQTFLRMYRMCKVAYRVDMVSEHPHIHFKTFGPGWSALVKFFDDYRAELEHLPIHFELCLNWTLQFEDSDAIPIEGAIVAKYSLEQLEKDKANWIFDGKRKYFRLLFSVTPQAQKEIEQVLSAVLEGLKEPGENRYEHRYHRTLTEMVLKETYLCVRLYQHFPELIIELAKVSWFMHKRPEPYSSEYLYQAFGLTGYPFEYFSASANQTPFRYLFRFHSKMAIDFLIELCNRATAYYLKSEYAKYISQLSIVLADESKIIQYGDHTLWVTFRGGGSSPYLLQSALMAFENHLLDRAEQGETLSEVFNDVMRRSNSVLLTGVLSSIAIAFPLIFEKNVLVLLKNREFYSWDLSRYAQELTTSASNLGDNRYHTDERRKSNALKHRRFSMEDLVSRLQLFFGQEVHEIVDAHKFEAEQADDPLWRLAIARMDIRDKDVELDEEKGVIHFKPKPLPEDLAHIVEDGEKEHASVVAPMASLVWAANALDKGTIPANLDEWRIKYYAISKSGTKNDLFTSDPMPLLAAVAIRDLLDRLSPEEKEGCSSIVSQKLFELTALLRAGRTFSPLQIFEKKIFSSFPFLLDPRLLPFVDPEKVKNAILDFLILSPLNEKGSLLDSIHNKLWEIDPDTAEKCFTCLIRLSNSLQVEELYQMRREMTPTEFEQSISESLECIKALTPVGPSDIHLHTGNKDHIAAALFMTPYARLNTDYNPYLLKVLEQFGTLENTEQNDQFSRHLEFIVSAYLINTQGDGSKLVLSKLFELVKGQPLLVGKILKRFTMFAHDFKYPDSVWDHFQTIFDHAVTKDSRVLYFDTVLFGSVKSFINKLPATGPIANMHEGLVKQYSADPNIVGSVFKLLSGIGVAYQPSSLRWIMHALPHRAALDQILFYGETLKHCENFVQQLYNNHLDHIRSNGDMLNYLITLLTILIEQGSLLAFRIRDEIL